MPLLSELPGEVKRKKLAKALEGLGFVINKQGGRGSHYKIICPINGKMIILPNRLDKDVLYYVVREIEKYTDYTWQDIKNKF